MWIWQSRDNSSLLKYCWDRLFRFFFIPNPHICCISENDLLSYWFFFFYLLSAGITSRYHHAWFIWCWKLNLASFILGEHSMYSFTHFCCYWHGILSFPWISPPLPIFPCRNAALLIYQTQWNINAVREVGNGAVHHHYGLWDALSFSSRPF